MSRPAPWCAVPTMPSSRCRRSPRCQGERRLGTQGMAEAALDLSITIHRLALLVNHEAVNHEAMAKRLSHADH